MGYLHYKGYTGCVEYDEVDNSFFGHVLGLRGDGISYEGTSADCLKRDFQESIDDYLGYCREIGKEPEKPFSGKLVIRMDSNLHREAAEKASHLGISLNEFINRAISSAVLL
jgi:predicted HicB family RNase H-like nuclease